MLAVSKNGKDEARDLLTEMTKVEKKRKMQSNSKSEIKIEYELGGYFLIKNKAQDGLFNLEKKHKSGKEKDARILITPGSSNSIINTLFKESREKLWMRNDHVLNFMSCDCILNTPVGRELIEQSLININDLKDENSQVGQIFSVMIGKYEIFHLFIKKKFNDKFYTKNFESVMQTLLIGLKQKAYISFSMARDGNGFDKISWELIKQILRTIFGRGEYQITICTGEIEIPKKEIRKRIIEENDDSTLGGHKEEIKTYERVRENYNWKGMKKEIQDNVRTCENCQKKKLVRIKTKQPMQITDTLIRIFQKIQMAIVGPLPTTYLLTWQDCLSKYSGAIPLINIEAPTIAVAFAESFICLFGCPKSIQTDQGKQFLGAIMENLAKIFKIKQP